MIYIHTIADLKRFDVFVVIWDVLKNPEDSTSTKDNRTKNRTQEYGEKCYITKNHTSMSLCVKAKLNKIHFMYLSISCSWEAILLFFSKLTAKINESASVRSAGLHSSPVFFQRSRGVPWSFLRFLPVCPVVSRSCLMWSGLASNPSRTIMMSSLVSQGSDAESLRHHPVSDSCEPVLLSSGTYRTFSPSRRMFCLLAAFDFLATLFIWILYAHVSILFFIHSV